MAVYKGSNFLIPPGVWVGFRAQAWRANSKASGVIKRSVFSRFRVYSVWAL